MHRAYRVCTSVGLPCGLFPHLSVIIHKQSVGPTLTVPYSSLLRASRFAGYKQQDSQELLRYLLDSLRNEEIGVRRVL